MYENIVAILSRQLQADPDLIDEDTNILDDLGADSLDVVELLMAIEENFGVTIPDDDINDIKTVGDLCEYVENHADLDESDII